MTKNLHKFFIKVVDSDDVETRLEQISALDNEAKIEEIKSWASEYGIELSEGDFNEAASEVELDLDEMEDVSGGRSDLHKFINIVLKKR